MVVKNTDPTVSSNRTVSMGFDDNSLLLLLFGDHDRHIARIEQSLNVIISSRGNEVSISGSDGSVALAKTVLDDLYGQLKRGLSVGVGEIDAVIRMEKTPINIVKKSDSAELIQTRKRTIGPRSSNQAEYFKALREMDLTFALGPAGTGKTYLAVAMAVSLLVNGDVERIILSRPAVEAGEHLGFLPGDMQEKVDPYMRPLYDALFDMLPVEQVTRRIENGEIEIAPLAFMRGRTLTSAFVILDEAQNATPIQMKMFLTRLGENSRMAVMGDLSQIDLPITTKSGLREAVKILDGVDQTTVVKFSDEDVVRNPLVTRIVRAYDAYEKSSRS